MNLSTQHIVLGLMSLKRYKFDNKTAELINLSTKKPKAIMCINKKYIYRFALGFAERIDVPADEFCYLMYYGIFNPLAKILHNDGDIFNNLKPNLTATAINNEIPLDVKDKIYKLFSDGKGYAFIGKKLNVNRQTVKQILQKHYGEIHPHQFRRVGKILESFQPPKI